MRQIKLTTKLAIIVGVISAFIAIVSSYAVIQIAFRLTENRIRDSLVRTHKEVDLLAIPSKSNELAVFLRSNDLSLLIFNEKHEIVARYGIYRNIDTKTILNLMDLKGYMDKNIESFGNYDIYTEDNIQIAIRNDFLNTLGSAFGLNLLIVSPIVLLISSFASLFVAKLVLSPLTKAESISHELKTPLTRAVSSLQVIASDSPVKLKAEIDKVTSDLIQLGGNVDTLLTLSLYKKRNTVVARTSDVKTEFEKVKNIVPINLKFDYKISRNMNLPMSSNFTNIILRNLLDNASKYNKVDGYVNFRAQVLGNDWVIEVENSKGLRKKGLGYGLGMTIVREICHFQKLHLEQEETDEVYKIKITG